MDCVGLTSKRHWLVRLCVGWLWASCCLGVLLKLVMSYNWQQGHGPAQTFTIPDHRGGRIFTHLCVFPHELPGSSTPARKLTRKGLCRRLASV